MTVDADALREHVETDLADTALDRLIADAYNYCAGVSPNGDQTVVLFGGDRYLILPHAITDAADVDSITERVGSTATVLDAADWRWNGGRILERLVGGAPAYWAQDVEVVYTPADDTARRDRVVIDLCKLAIQFNALSSERAGDYQATGVEYARERDRIVRQLVSGVRVA